MIDSFTKFIANCGDDGIAVINADSPNAVKAVRNYKGNIVTYSTAVDSKADFTCNNIEFTYGLPSFDVFLHGEFIMRAKLSVPGAHNISNALAAIASAKLCSLPNEAILEGLEQFHGVCRRFEYKGTCNEANVYDDYAHHPQEIAATLAAARNMNPRSIVAIVEPHTYTRLHDFLDDFATALSAADKVIVAPIYAAREQNAFGITQYDLSNKINNSIAFDNFEEINKYVRNNIVKGDIVLTLGAGDITELSNMLVS